MAGKVQSWTEKLYRIFSNDLPGEQEGVFVSSRNSLRVLSENESLFGETLTAQRRTSISINSAYGVSKLRQVVNTSGAASVSDETKGKIILSTGATAGSESRISSAEVGIYAPGFSAEIGLGVRPQQVLAGEAFARWGAVSVDKENGLYFKLTADGSIAAVRRKDNVEEDVIDRSDWNIDRFDGTGSSGINVAAIEGYIYQIDFTWYGYGLIVFGIVRQMQDFREVQHFIPGHVIQTEDDISISEPNMQVFAEINNGDQAVDYKLDVGGMQYSTVGINDGARKRTVDDYVSGTSVDNTNDTHLISFRRKPDFLTRSFTLDQLNTVAAGSRIIFEVWIGGTVTLGSGVTYSNPTGYDPDETSIESVREQTFDRTGATLLYRTSAESGDGKQEGAAGQGFIDLNLPANSIITLTARTEASNATVSWALLRGREGW